MVYLIHSKELRRLKMAKKKKHKRDRMFVIDDLEVLQEDLTDTVILEEMVRILSTKKLNQIVQFIAKAHEIDLNY